MTNQGLFNNNFIYFILFYFLLFRIRLAIGNGLRPDIWKQFQKRFNIDVIAGLYSFVTNAHS